MGKYDTIKTLLYGISIQLETATKMLEDIEDREAAANDSVCKHENKLNLTTMGGPERWKCKDCGFEYEGQSNGVKE
jgi:transposase-like protein